MPIEELLARLLAGGEHETYPLASEEDVAETEAALGVQLPPSYLSFVTHFSNGAYLFSLQEVSAVGAGNPQISAIQNVAGDGFPAERGARVAAAAGDAVPGDALIPFSLDSNGNCWCFLTDRRTSDGEYELAYCDTQAVRLVGQLASFEAWLSILIREQDEVIRTLGLADELGLG